ncbi:hypothetical protein AGMMS49975_26940 [Clostridia bacterium]|nr:hypothetical protein AGMMS49975_26940 [Clostridia bacterium]
MTASVNKAQILKKETRLFKGFIRYADCIDSACSRHGISENDLLAIIREDIINLLNRVSIDETRIDSEIYKRLNSKPADEVRRRLEQLAVRIEELESVSGKLYEDRFKGFIKAFRRRGTLCRRHEQNNPLAEGIPLA